MRKISLLKNLLSIQHQNPVIVCLWYTQCETVLKPKPQCFRSHQITLQALQIYLILPQKNLQGLAPSATRRRRRVVKLTSLWSFWASKPQCMSLDFTTATDAVYNKHLLHTIISLDHIFKHKNLAFFLHYFKLFT